MQGTQGSFGGLGIEIAVRDGVLTVISPMEGTPAYRMGIQGGDRIVLGREPAGAQGTLAPGGPCVGRPASAAEYPVPTPFPPSRIAEHGSPQSTAGGTDRQAGVNPAAEGVPWG